MSDQVSPLVTAEELLADGSDQRVQFVDAAWFLDPSKNGLKEYEVAHLPGAVHFDIDVIADQETNLPHMLPSPERFAREAGAIGLCEDTPMVVYDPQGIFSAPRVWWTLMIMGANNVRVLNGGLPAWRHAGGKVTRGLIGTSPRTFQTSFHSRSVVGRDEMLALVKEGKVHILDARPTDRFFGRAPEPRAGLASGHMPGALSVPVSDVVKNGHMLPPGALSALFAARGLTPGDAVVTTCGSGVTAAVLHLALTTAGYDGVRIYDGSWAEWGADPAHPVTTEAAST